MMNKKYLSANDALTLLDRTWVITDENDNILTDLITEQDADFILAIRDIYKPRGVPYYTASLNYLNPGDWFMFSNNPAFVCYELIRIQWADSFNMAWVEFKPVGAPPAVKFITSLMKTDVILKLLKEEVKHEIL